MMLSVIPKGKALKRAVSYALFLRIYTAFSVNAEEGT